MPEYERLHVQLIPKASEALQRAMDAEQMSKTDIVNRALQLYAFIAQQRAAGAEIVLHHRDGLTERVQLL